MMVGTAAARSLTGRAPVSGTAMDTRARDSAVNITELLTAWGGGDRAALEALVPRIQKELYRLAAYYMAGERRGHVLQTTALVNEAYVRLVDWQHVEWSSRAHFFGVAAQIMRRVLVDLARARGRAKRGGNLVQVSIGQAEALPERRVDFMALDDALKSLEELDSRQSRVVELRFFGGLSLEETAAALGVSVATVRRDWGLARAWLFRQLTVRRGAR